jgi:hypothetical protein
MLRLLYTCMEITWLRKGPQDLPSSAGTVLAALSLYAILGTAFSHIQLPMGRALLQAGVDLGLLVGFTTLLLRWRGLGQRVPQTLVGMAGTGALFTLMAFPAMVSLLAAAEQGGDASLPSLLLLALMLWNLAVIGHIWRHALNTTLAIGMSLAVAYALLSLALLATLFPEAA